MLASTDSSSECETSYSPRRDIDKAPLAVLIGRSGDCVLGADGVRFKRHEDVQAEIGGDVYS